MSRIFCYLEPKNPEQGLEHNEGQASSSSACISSSQDGAQAPAQHLSYGNMTKNVPVLSLVSEPEGHLEAFSSRSPFFRWEH